MPMTRIELHCARLRRLFLPGLLGTSVFAVGLSSCVGDSPSDDPRPELLESWARKGAMARYARVSQLGGELAEELHHVCLAAMEPGGTAGAGGDEGGPGEACGSTPLGGQGGQGGQCAGDGTARLARARDLYDEARRNWLLCRSFAFGPEMDQPGRLGANIDFQPPRHESIDELLDSAEPLPAPELTGAHLRGFSALEYLLYGERSQDLTTGDGRTCRYGRGVAEDLKSNARRLLEAWDPEGGDFLASIVTPEEIGVPFESVHDALSEIVNRMAFTLENIRRDEIDVALGEDAERALPHRVLSRLSGRSLEDIGDQVDGIEQLYFGFGDDPGLSDYARSRGYDFDLDFRQAVEGIRNSLSALGPSLELAIESDRIGVERLELRLRDLQVLIQVDIVGALGLTQTFNDNDGD